MRHSLPSGDDSSVMGQVKQIAVMSSGLSDLSRGSLGPGAAKER